MTYRKIKKAYVKRFGVIMMIKLYRKDGKYIIKASKKVTASHMRRILIEKAKGNLSYFATDK